MEPSYLRGGCLTRVDLLTVVGSDSDGGPGDSSDGITSCDGSVFGTSSSVPGLDSAGRASADTSCSGASVVPVDISGEGS